MPLNKETKLNQSEALHNMSVHQLSVYCKYLSLLHAHDMPRPRTFQLQQNTYHALKQFKLWKLPKIDQIFFFFNHKLHNDFYLYFSFFWLH